MNQEYQLDRRAALKVDEFPYSKSLPNAAPIMTSGTARFSAPRVAHQAAAFVALNRLARRCEASEGRGAQRASLAPIMTGSFFPGIMNPHMIPDRFRSRQAALAASSPGGNRWPARRCPIRIRGAGSSRSTCPFPLWRVRTHGDAHARPHGPAHPWRATFAVYYLHYARARASHSAYNWP